MTEFIRRVLIIFGMFFIQDLIYSRFDNSKPYFVLPISSLTKLNLKPLGFALYNLLEQGKDEKISN